MSRARRVRTGSPHELTGRLRVGPRRTVAAGVEAVVEATRHLLSATDPATATSAMARANQVDGFDCPSCAWPDPDEHRSFAEFCENGAKAIAEATATARADAAFFAAHSVVELSERPDRWLAEQGRITQPMVLRPDASHYEPITWDAAFALVGEELRALPSPDRAVFYTSGRTSNEAAFLYQLFVRALGTNNLPDCSNMCHESSGTALSATIGIGKGTVLLEDFDHAEAIVVLGQNPGTNHPRMLTALQRAKERGAVVVGVNPLPEAGLVAFRNPQDLTSPGRVGRALSPRPTRLMDHFVPVSIGGDLAFLSGVQKALFERDDEVAGSVDRAWVAANVAPGELDALEAHVRGLEWELLEAEAGVSRDHMRALAGTLAVRRNVIWCWAMGLTQHEHAVATIQQVVNLALLRGAIGRRGAGLCPVRGHSNVQGDRTMGIWERPPEAFLDALEQRFDLVAPRRHGLDTVEAIEAMGRGDVEVFVGMGGNFVAAAPDTEATARALQNCRLTVQVSTTLNRSHLVTGRTALVLPTMTRPEAHVTAAGEQFVTVENSMGIVHASHGHLPKAAPSLRHEVEIVAGLARATLGEDSAIDWEGLASDHDAIRDAIEAVVPGFDDCNRRVREPGGFALPNGPREGRFTTTDGRAHLTTHHVPRRRLEPGELLLMTIRSHDQFNTHLYGEDDRYRGIHGERRVVFCNPDDLADRGLAQGDVVDLVSEHGGVERRARRFVVVPYAIPPDCCAAYFPEANPVVPLDHTAHHSNTPASKSVRIRLEPAHAAGEGA